jgi:hypothetical protein
LSLGLERVGTLARDSRSHPTKEMHTMTVTTALCDSDDPEEIRRFAEQLAEFMRVFTEHCDRILAHFELNA